LASLTTEEVVNRVAARLQEQGIGNREQQSSPSTPSPVPRRLMKTPPRATLSRKGARATVDPGARGQGKTHLPICPPHHLPRSCCRTRACGRWKAPSWSSMPAASRAR
jgi:hypothetical protein